MTHRKNFVLKLNKFDIFFIERNLWIRSSWYFDSYLVLSEENLFYNYFQISILGVSF